MGDLMREYFERDLSVKELDRLERLLDLSEENALAFARNAASFYAALGLPEGPRPRWRRWSGGLGGALALAAGLWLGRQVLAPVPDAAPVPSPAAAHPLPRAAAPTATPRRARIAPATAIPEPPPALPGPQDLLPPAYDQLAVSLHLEAGGPVRVRVLTVDGAEVALLQDGALSAGDWHFRWNGLDARGLPSPAGRYVIEVRGSGTVRTREILLKANP